MAIPQGINSIWGANGEAKSALALTRCSFDRLIPIKAAINGQLQGKGN